jgi:hypothetical protein
VNWVEAIALLIILLGLGAGAFLVAQRPAFWLAMGSEAARRLWPLALRYATKRMSPEEKAWQDAVRRGQGDEWLRNRRKRRG